MYFSEYPVQSLYRVNYKKLLNKQDLLNRMTASFPSYPELHALIFDADRIPYAVLAIILSLMVGVVTGPRAGNANPMVWIWIDSAFGALGDRLDKKQRPAPDLMFRGFMLMALAVVLGCFFGLLCDYLVQTYPFHGLMRSALITLALTGGSVWFVLLRLYFALEHKQLVQGTYYGVARTSRVNLNSTDDFGITRVGMAMAARTLDKGIVAPVIWYLIGGFPALFVYSGLGALAWRFGKDGFTKGFGAVPLALEKLLGFIPSLITTFLISAASVITPTANITKSVRSWLGKSVPYAQGGAPLTAMAWALEVTLGGPTKDLSGSAIQSEWAGPPNATAKVGHMHLRRSLYINVMAQLLFIAMLLGAYVWSGRL